MEHQEVIHMIWTIYHFTGIFWETLNIPSLHMTFLIQNNNIYIFKYILVLFMHETLYVLIWGIQAGEEWNSSEAIHT